MFVETAVEGGIANFDFMDTIDVRKSDRCDEKLPMETCSLHMKTCFLPQQEYWLFCAFYLSYFALF